MNPGPLPQVRWSCDKDAAGNFKDQKIYRSFCDLPSLDCDLGLTSNSHYVIRDKCDKDPFVTCPSVAEVFKCGFYDTPWGNLVFPGFHCGE